MQQNVSNNYFILLNKIKYETNSILKEHYRIILNSSYGNCYKP